MFCLICRQSNQNANKVPVLLLLIKI
jgi:hypothetical protein